MEIPCDFKKELDAFISELENKLHLEMFKEEYEAQYDSTSEVYNRNNGINPMSKKVILNMAKKRRELGVSNLASNGLPKDNSSELYVRKLILNYILEKYGCNDEVPREKLNISTFFKSQKANLSNPSCY